MPATMTATPFNRLLLFLFISFENLQWRCVQWRWLIPLTCSFIYSSLAERVLFFFCSFYHAIDINDLKWDNLKNWKVTWHVKDCFCLVCLWAQGIFLGAVTLCGRVFGRDGRSLGYQRSGHEKRAVLVLLPYHIIQAPFQNDIKDSESMPVYVPFLTIFCSRPNYEARWAFQEWWMNSAHKRYQTFRKHL